MPTDPFAALAGDEPSRTPPPDRGGPDPWEPDPYEDEAGRNPCPTLNCRGGDVSLAEYPQEDGSILFGGPCDSCAQDSVKCPECEALTWLPDGDETRCETGCGAVFQKDLDRKAITAGFLRVR